MSNRLPTVAVVVPNGAAPTNRDPLELILLNADGTSAGTVKKAAVQADTVAADLAALKVDFNALLAKLRTAGVIATP